MRLWSGSPGKAELEPLRDALLAKAKAIIATGAVANTEEDMTFPSPTRLSAGDEVARPSRSRVEPLIPKAHDPSLSDGDPRDDEVAITKAAASDIGRSESEKRTHPKSGHALGRIPSSAGELRTGTR